MRIKFTYYNYKYSRRATFFSWVASCFFAITCPIAALLSLGLLMGIYEVITAGSWDSFFIGIIASLIGVGYITLFLKVIFPLIEKLASRDQRRSIGANPYDTDEIVKRMNEKMNRR